MPERPNHKQAMSRYRQTIPTPEEAIWLSPRQVSGYLGMSVNTVLDLLRRGILPGINIAKEGAEKPRWKVATADLRKFLGLD